MLSTFPESDPESFVPQVIDELNRCGASIVYLCPTPPNEIEAQSRKISRLAPLFHAAGFEVGVWIGTIGHIDFSAFPNAFSPMVDLDGEKASYFYCPTDEAFTAYICSILAQFASCGIDALMVDDDFRINFNYSKPYCFCDRHLKRIGQILGRPVTREELREVLFTGKSNPERRAYLEANRQILEEFAKNIRSAVDAVNPDIPVRLCSGAALWGADGADPTKIAKILAGKNPAYMRLSGGPYWIVGSPGLRLQYVIDLVRCEAAYCRENGVSAFGEADSYPRPRHVVAASQLELYDLALRADGNADGNLKYVFDYVADFAYERGYVSAANKHLPLYDAVENTFCGKTASGFSVFMPFTLTEDFIGTPETPTPDLEAARWYNPAIKLLCDTSIPSHFAPEGPGIAFGNSARRISEERLSDGWVLDLPAAKALTERGIDVGLLEDLGSFATTGKTLFGRPFMMRLSPEKYCPSGEFDLHVLRTCDSVKTLTTYERDGKSCSGEYFYENEKGQRFVVFPFDAAKEQNDPWLFKTYYRQQELIDVYRMLSGKSLDAVCPGNPYLYLMVKKDEHSVSVGLWNFSQDAIEAPEILLAKTFTTLETVNCTGSVDGSKVTLSRLPAQEFCCFTVS